MNNQHLAQWVSNKFDPNSRINSDALMTHLLFNELSLQTECEDLLSLFWVNLRTSRKTLAEARWSAHGVYCYPHLNGEIVLSTPTLEVKIGNCFSLNLDYNSITPEIVSDGLLPILKSILDERIIITDCEDDSTKNYLSIGDIPVSLKEAFNIASSKTSVVNGGRKLVASPPKKQVATKDLSAIPFRETYGWRKSYSELHDILDDYLLDAGDVSVLPVINADLLDTLKLEGGVYVDTLTDVEVTYEGYNIIVCGEAWKVNLSASVRNGRYTVYSSLASIDERYHSDLREVAKVLHALNNLYKKRA